MYQRPEYACNIIVGLCDNKSFNWYVLDKNLCYLDYNKYDDFYFKAGMPVEVLRSPERENLVVLDRDNIRLFLQKVDKYKVSSAQLQSLLIKEREKNNEDLLDFSPCLYIDFDKRILLSLYPEPDSFEKNIPDGWVGAYKDFTEMIPENERYWMGKNKENLLVI